MFRAICSTFPIMVCLCWFVTFLLRTRHNDSAQRVLTVFLGVSTVLYLCHAFYFNGGLSTLGESLWALCSLSVYPLYYIYISRLTCRPLSRKWQMMILLPGVFVAIAILLYCDAVDVVRKLLFVVQVVLVLVFGFRRLKAYDREVANMYADTEGRDASAVKTLLVAFVVTSAVSSVVNIIGKQFFVTIDFLAPIAAVFGVLLYALSYIGYTRNFSPEQFESNMNANSVDCDAQRAGNDDSDEQGRRIDEIIKSKRYLVKNLKITDLAHEAGTCRTYVSNYINKKYNVSFSDYVNHLRIEHAMRLLREGEERKMAEVAEKSGFSSTQSFYRNFKKFVGMTPIEWQSNFPDGE